MKKRNAGGLLAALAITGLLLFWRWAPGSSEAPGPPSLPVAPLRAGPPGSGVRPAEAVAGAADPGASTTAPRASPTGDGGVGGADANELSGLVRAFSDGAIRARLERNGKRAAAEIDRFCELSAKLNKQPLFPEAPGTRDAAVFMASRVDWEGTPPRLGSLHVPEAIKAHVAAGPDWLLTVTDADLTGLDFGWMKQLLAFDVWTFTGDGAADDLRVSAMASDIPNFVTLQTQAKLRFSRAYRVGDWNDAVLEVRHLARLVHTMSLAIAEAIAVVLLKLEIRARDQAARLGVDLSSLPPLPDASLLGAHREVGIRGGWFVAPGVPEAVRRRALDCAAMKCTTVLEGLSLQSSLRTWAPAGSMESFLEETRGLGCEPALVSRLARMPPAKLDDLHWLLDEENEGPLLPIPDGGR